MGSDLLKKAGSSGRPIKNVKIEISNKGIDNNGEIVVSGPNVMLGYYNDAEKLAKLLLMGNYIRVITDILMRMDIYMYKAVKII